MGVFYNSFCVHGERRSEVAGVLESWLTLKGFTRSSQPLLFDLDGETERHAFIIWNQHWTVLLYSHFDEELRLARALCNDLEPMLYVWVYDGEVWGWDLCAEGGLAGSYNSDPQEHQSFSDIPIGSPMRPAADVKRLVSVLGLEESECQALQKLERRGTRHRTETCDEFCRRLGLDAAVTTYDDLESGILDRLDGWSVESLLFVRRDFQEPKIDLKTYDPADHRISRWTPQVTLELSTELFAEMEKMRRQTRRKMQFLRPLARLAQVVRRARTKLTTRFADTFADETPPPRPTFRRDGSDLVNDRHGCRLTLCEGAVPISSSSKPSAVFGFRVGQVDITCTARRIHQIHDVLRRPSRSRVAHEEFVDVGGLVGRYLLFELPPGFSAGVKGTSWLWLFVVQAPRGLYVFLFRFSGALDPEQETLIRRVVESLYFEDRPER